MLYNLGYIFRDLLYNPPPKPAIEEEYVMGREVGRGGSGIVMHALHRKTGSYCAIKIINKLGRSDVLCRNIEKEVSIMRHLRHPNICRMIDVFYEPIRTCEL